ncbi:MAG: zf-HC2 domain-containing protein [Methylotenera sp.]|nr:zf-HC2 domain-containing protein [Oligoflexia bacterium]
MSDLTKDSINCFEWQNRSSDFLDGTLIGTPRRLADEHLDSCESCSERHRRYVTLLSTISSQPRAAVPIPLRQAPLAFSLPKLDISNSRSKWQQTPWFIRTGVEGLGLACITLIVISMVPKMRSLYERGIERKLEAFNVHDDSEYTEDSGLASAPLVRGKPVDAGATSPTGEFTPVMNTVPAEDFSASEGESEQTGKKMKVGNAEIWRFNLKTDSPHQIRPQIVKTLVDLKIPANTPGLGGIEAPGGIQFDLLVPQSVIPNLKAQLQKLAASGHIAAKNGVKVALVSNDSTSNQPFTWYKNKSKREIPKGRARIVIWLSQI